MKARREENLVIKYGLSAWFFGMSLLLCLSLADEVKVGPVYLDKDQAKPAIVTGLNIEVAQHEKRTSGNYVEQILADARKRL